MTFDADRARHVAMLDLQDRVRQDHVWIYQALESWRAGRPLYVTRSTWHRAEKDEPRIVLAER